MKIAADRYAVAIAYFLIYVVWGSTYYFIGVALEGFPTFLLGALRFSVAGVVLLLLCHIRGEKVFRPALVRRSAISGIVLLFVDMAVIMLAQRYINSSLVAIVASSTAIWITLFDVPVAAELPPSVHACGIVVGIYRSDHALYGAVGRRKRIRSAWRIWHTDSDSRLHLVVAGYALC